MFRFGRKILMCPKCTSVLSVFGATEAEVVKCAVCNEEFVCSTNTSNLSRIDGMTRGKPAFVPLKFVLPVGILCVPIAVLFYMVVTEALLGGDVGPEGLKAAGAAGFFVATGLSAASRWFPTFCAIITEVLVFGSVGALFGGLFGRLLTSFGIGDFSVILVSVCTLIGALLAFLWDSCSVQVSHELVAPKWAKQYASWGTSVGLVGGCAVGVMAGFDLQQRGQIGVPGIIGLLGTAMLSGLLATLLLAGVGGIIGFSCGVFRDIATGTREQGKGQIGLSQRAIVRQDVFATVLSKLWKIMNKKMS